MAKKKSVRSVSKSRPVGVSILAVLAYIGAVFTLILGISMIVGSAAISTVLLKFAPQYTWLTGVGIAAFIGIGIILLACAVLNYFIGKGLWKGQNWARILVIVLSILSILGNLSHPISGIVGIVISAVIIWYLGFNKEAISYFR